MLPIHQIETINKLKGVDEELIKARFIEPKAIDLSEKEAKIQIAVIVTNTLNALGAKDSDDKKLIVNLTELIFTDMTTRFKHLTLGELKIALNEGLRGNYGEFFGLNISTINKWLKAFELSEKRKTALDYYNHLLTMQAPKPEPTAEEKEKLLQKACIDAYEDFKEGKPFTLIPRIVYDYLKKYFNIKWSPAEVVEIKKVANTNFEAELKRKKMDREITSNQFEAALKEKSTLDLEMKKVALKYYFAKLLKENKKLSF